MARDKSVKILITHLIIMIMPKNRSVECKGAHLSGSWVADGDRKVV